MFHKCSQIRPEFLIAILIIILSGCENDFQQTINSLGDNNKPKVLPVEFSQYKDNIGQSLKKYVRIEPHVAKNTDILDSKFLGQPFIPAGYQYPAGKDGSQIVLLAQINFKDFPALENFPQTGVLQIYISPGMNKSHVWGMNMYSAEEYNRDDYFKNLQDQDYFRVLYFTDAEVNGEAASYKSPSYKSYDMPVTAEMKLEFELDSEPVNIEDFHFKKYFGMNSYEFYDKYKHLDWDILDSFYNYLSSDAIAKSGGYGRFVQEDPRLGLKSEDEWMILLNIESADIENESILWGDAGVATFFIRKQDLLNLDFSRVAYYWDNH